MYPCDRSAFGLHDPEPIGVAAVFPAAFRQEKKILSMSEFIRLPIRALLLCKGSLQPAAEMGDMIREITKEVWYRNEDAPEAPDQVAAEWRVKYLTKWREARMFEAFILIEKRTEQLLKILKG